ncbi:unnamed protein product [Closterium sp. NIES-53]
MADWASWPLSGYVPPLLGENDRANEIFKKVHDLKSIRGRSNEATYAACLYIACRQEDKPRTFKGGWVGCEDCRCGNQCCWCSQPRSHALTYPPTLTCPPPLTYRPPLTCSPSRTCSPPVHVLSPSHMLSSPHMLPPSHAPPLTCSSTLPRVSPSTTSAEIGSAGNNISKKEIGRATKFIVKQLEADMGAVDMGAVNAGDFMVSSRRFHGGFSISRCRGSETLSPLAPLCHHHSPLTPLAPFSVPLLPSLPSFPPPPLLPVQRRFCSHLGMKGAPVQAAIEVVQNTEHIDIRTSRAPISKAAAAIYMVTQLCSNPVPTKGSVRVIVSAVTQLCSNPVPTKDISRATVVAEGTIRNTYKDLLPSPSPLQVSCFSCTCSSPLPFHSLPPYLQTYHRQQEWQRAPFATPTRTCCPPPFLSDSPLPTWLSFHSPFTFLVCARHIAGNRSGRGHHTQHVQGPAALPPPFPPVLNPLFLPVCHSLFPALLPDISRATGVAEGTIRNTYKDLLPFASRLLPESYAKPEDIAKLSPS